MDRHILPLKTLLTVLAALLVLTAVTVGVSRLDLGAFGVWAALGIASLKASLVLLYFMHLKYEGPLIRRTFLMTVGILAVLILFVFMDTAFRSGGIPG